MKKSALTKIHKLVFGFVLVLGFVLAGTFNQNSKASFGDRTINIIADGEGTAGQLAKTGSKGDGTAGQQM